MALSPVVARYLPAKLRAFSQGLRYPHVFLVSIPAFIVALLSFEHIPHGQEVVIALAVVLYMSSKLR